MNSNISFDGFRCQIRDLNLRKYQTSVIDPNQAEKIPSEDDLLYEIDKLLYVEILPKSFGHKQVGGGKSVREGELASTRFTSQFRNGENKLLNHKPQQMFKNKDFELAKKCTVQLLCEAYNTAKAEDKFFACDCEEHRATNRYNSYGRRLLLPELGYRKILNPFGQRYLCQQRIGFPKTNTSVVIKDIVSRELFGTF